MNTSAVTDLIAKLEAAEEGSRELDAEIYWHFAPENCRFNDGPDGSTEKWVVEPKYWGRLDEGPPCGRAIDDAEHYTTSLDAAMTLVPKGFMLRKMAEFPDGWSITIMDGAKSFDAHCLTTAPIGLCIACLKAADHD